MTCNGVQFKLVNAATTKQAPPEAMVQLGQTLPLLVHLIAANYNLQQPFKFCKLDITAKFWCMAVSDKDA